MSNLYIFGIGGTGSRILKSLTMLLATGVKLPNVTKVIPIIIDPDLSNGDMNRTVQLLKLYHEIRDKVDNPEDFFGTPIETLDQSQNQGSYFNPDQFKFSLNGTENKKFNEFIGKSILGKENEALTDLLFSDHNLAASMEVGFKGNPNIGSVVLNQLVNNQQFCDFANGFRNGDKIFVVNSIFGGTGAAGFPLLIKNLRNSTILNANEVNNAVIGGLTVLPYFDVSQDEDSEIDSSTFMDKAKSAMGYYDRALLQTGELNAFYYIGDTVKSSVSNSEGGASQKNNAHFVELASAMAIVDFCKDAPTYQTSNAKSVTPTVFKEYGVSADEHATSLNFSNLDPASRELLVAQFTKFTMSSLYLKFGLDKSLSKKTQWVVDENTKTDSNFFKSPDYTNAISLFFDHYIEWLEEMKENQISFAPFKLNVSEKEALHFVEGMTPTKKGLLKSNDTFDGVTKKNNENFQKHKGYSATHQLVKMLEESCLAEIKERKLMNL